MSLLGTVFLWDDMFKNKRCNDLNYPNVTEINDIIYNTAMPDICKLDLVFDEKQRGRFTKNKYPVLINIHGGGWIVGDKKYRRGFSLQFGNAGIMVVNINYGLAPKYQYPTYVQNIFSALKWVEDNADKYGFDLDNLFMSGDSAGAHLTAVTQVCLENVDLRKKFGVYDCPLRFKGTLLFCGPYELDNPLMKLPLVDVMLKQMCGIKHLKDLKNYKYYNELNPIPYITDKFPKSLVISGAQDFFTAGQHQKIMAKFTELGIPYNHYHGTDFFNCFHCFHLKVYMKEARNCISEAIKFIWAIIPPEISSKKTTQETAEV